MRVRGSECSIARKGIFVERFRQNFVPPNLRAALRVHFADVHIHFSRITEIDSVRGGIPIAELHETCIW